MKKIITVIAILSMIFSVIPTTIFAESAETETADYESNIEFLEAVGALPETDYGKDRILTRAEFADLVVKIVGYEQFLEAAASAGKELDLSYLTEKGWVYVPQNGNEESTVLTSDTPFADVSTDDASYGAINLVTTLGFMTDDDTYFRPNDNITCGEALRAMSVLLNLGCGQKLTTSEHAAKAMYEGILTKVSEKNITRPVRMKDIAVMLINALKAKPFIVAFEGGGVQYKQKKNYTLMNQLYDVYDAKGVVNANEYAALKGCKTTKKGEVTIGGENYKFDNFDFDELLGYDLKVYYVIKDSDRHMIYYEERTDRNDILTVDAENIISFENHVFKYWDDDKIKTVSVKNDTSVVYNGVSVNSYADTAFTPENGRVVFMETGGSSTYNLAKITKYDMMIVKSVDYKNEAVLADVGDIKRFNVSDYGEAQFFMADGTEVVFATISKDVVLSIAATLPGQKNRCSVIVSNNTISGKLKSVDTSEETLVIDEEEYDYNSEFMNFDNITMNTDITLYLDKDRTAVSYKLKGESNAAYGYLRKVKYDETDDNKCYIKIYAADDTFKSYTVKDRIFLNGKSIKVRNIKDYLLDSKGVTKYQVVKYITTEDGNLTGLITADGKEGEFSKYDISTLGITELTHRNGGLLSYGNNGFNAFLNSGGYVAFAIPKDREDDDNYGVIKSFNHEEKYSFDELYLKSADSSFIDVCVQLDVTTEKTFDSNSATSYTMLSEVKKCIDDKDEEYYELNGIGLAAASYKCYDDELFAECEKLGKGDIVRFNVNGMSGYVTYIKKFYDAEEKRMVTGISTFGESIYGDNLHPNELFSGWAVDTTDSEQILLAHKFVYANGKPDISASQADYKRTTARMFKYPTRIVCYNSDTKRVAIGSKQDVVYSTDIMFGSTILVGSYYENAQIMFVIK